MSYIYIGKIKDLMRDGDKNTPETNPKDWKWIEHRNSVEAGRTRVGPGSSSK